MLIFSFTIFFNRAPAWATLVSKELYSVDHYTVKTIMNVFANQVLPAGIVKPVSLKEKHAPDDV